MNRKMIALLLALYFLVAVCLLVVWVWDSYRAWTAREETIARLSNSMLQMDGEMIRRQESLVRWYHYCLTARNPPEDLESSYEGILNISDGMMGFLELPGQYYRIPVYHGVVEKTLASGAGHLPGSSLPVGGEGNHTVLIGPGEFAALEDGDLVYIHILKDTLVYQVREVRNVQRGNTAGLERREGEDLCTLITYMVQGGENRKIIATAARLDPLQEQEAIADKEYLPSLERDILERAAWASGAVLIMPLVTGGVGRSVKWMIYRVRCCRFTKRSSPNCEFLPNDH